MTPNSLSFNDSVLIFMVAVEKIGAETVTYVANIYKYYIAYNLIMEAMEERKKAAEEMKGQNN